MLIVLLLLCACATTQTTTPISPADLRDASNFGYTPLDPLPVKILPEAGLTDPRSNACYLENMPSQTMRLAIGSHERDGSLSFGPAKIGVKDSSYVVYLDYILYTTVPQAAEIVKDSSGHVEVLRVFTASAGKATPQLSTPIYLGAGARLIANVTVTSGSVDLSNLFGIGLAAADNRVSGSLVMQTMGLTGSDVGAAFTVPSKLDATTIQDALVTFGTLKAKLYESAVEVTPVVLGIDNNAGDGAQNIRAFISDVLRSPPAFPLSKRKDCD
jgi:hypothetical protein